MPTFWSKPAYCPPVVTTGIARVDPIKINCRNVLYLDTVVGCTSADGNEKSQYRVNVFGAGSEA